MTISIFTVTIINYLPQKSSKPPSEQQMKKIAIETAHKYLSQKYSKDFNIQWGREESGGCCSPPSWILHSYPKDEPSNNFEITVNHDGKFGGKIKYDDIQYFEDSFEEKYLNIEK